MLKLKGLKLIPERTLPKKNKLTIEAFAKNSKINLLLLFLALTFIVHFGMIKPLLDEKWENSAKSLVLTYKDAIEDQVRLVQNSIGQFFQKPDINQIILQKNTAQIQNIETTLKAFLPHALDFQIIHQGDSLENNSSPFLGYASRVQIQKGLKGEKTAPEFQRLENTKTVLNYVIPIYSLPLEKGTKNPPIGVVVFSQNPEFAYSLLPHVDNLPGFLEWRQKTNQGTQLIADLGNEKLKGNTDGVIAEFNAFPWEVVFWMSPQSRMVTLEYAISFFLIFGIAFFVMIFMVGDKFNRLKDCLTKDLLALEVWLKRKMHGITIQDVQFYLAPIAQLKSSCEEHMQTTPALDEKLEKTQNGVTNTDVPSQKHDTIPLPFIKSSIFRAYDIRGVVGEELNAALVTLIGKSIGSVMQSRKQKTIVVGQDGRLSSNEFKAALCAGLNEAGCDVIDIGTVPTPLVYYGAYTLKTGSGVMVTGSHNPANYNGFKVMVAGKTLCQEDISDLHQRITQSNFVSGSGKLTKNDLIPSYIKQIQQDIGIMKPLKVVLDGGNGVAGPLAVQLFKALNCEVIPLFCEMDGTFPNHHPDPGQPENLQALIKAVKENNADIGFAFDGDGDRLGVITNQGEIIWPDRIMMLFAKDILARNPGADIIFDVKCSRNLGFLIKENGGRPIMSKTGHSLIKAKMQETGALLGGEMSGHFFFKERWFGFDDALYAAVRLLEIISLSQKTTSEVFATLPNSVNTPEINIAISDDKKFQLIEKLIQNKGFGDGQYIVIDGLRVEYKDGWGLVRASNTNPSLVLRFEADTMDALARIQKQFKERLLAVEKNLTIPF